MYLLLFFRRFRYFAFQLSFTCFRIFPIKAIQIICTDDELNIYTVGLFLKASHTHTTSTAETKERKKTNFR